MKTISACFCQENQPVDGISGTYIMPSASVRCNICIRKCWLRNGNGKRMNYSNICLLFVSFILGRSITLTVSRITKSLGHNVFIFNNIYAWVVSIIIPCALCTYVFFWHPYNDTCTIFQRRSDSRLLNIAIVESPECMLCKWCIEKCLHVYVVYYIPHAQILHFTCHIEG